MRNPKIELYKDKKGEYRFRFKAANGKIIAVSEGYKTKQGCQNGYRSVIHMIKETLAVEIEEIKI